MYSTCLFCNAALGANESIEHFPVGRRLAFDSANGRLWVVCAHCERWNLSPLETRWEAIEEAERAYRGTKLRVSTDNIGLARLAEGTELVRIGAPQRPEFAAWRYGDQFGKRQRRFFIRTVAGSAGMMAAPYAVGGIMTSAPMMSVMTSNMLAGTAVLTGGVMATGLAASWGRLWIQAHTPHVTVRDNNSRLLRISKFNVHAATLSPAGHAFDWQLKVDHLNLRPAGGLARALRIPRWGFTVETTVLRHDAARNALATILPHTNQAGGSKRAVNAALDVLSDAPGVQYLMHLASTTKSKRQPKERRGEILLGLLPSSLRLALEMSLHEDDERRAMEGELKELEQRWREADAIAKIADEMFLPLHVDEQVREMRIETRRDPRGSE